MSLSFLAPQFLWALAAIPLVVALHFVRARKKRYEVSALFLWRRAQELAQRRRRFSPTLLLLLQLAFVTLAALALAQPALTLRSAPDRVFVIDASASMAARENGRTRLEGVLSEADALLGTSGRVAVVRAGLGATVALPLTEDRGALREALDVIEAADASADLSRALALARAVAPGAEVHLFTDDVPPNLESQIATANSTGPGVTLHSVGDSLGNTAGDTANGAQNLGISAFDLRGGQAFVSVVSNAPRPQEVELEVARGDAPAMRTTLLVPREGQANAAFPVDAVSSATPGTDDVYHAHINVPPSDALSLDDDAYVGSRALRAVLSPPSPPVERALGVVPGLNWRVSSAPSPGNADVEVLTSGFPAGFAAAVAGGTASGRYLVFAPPSPDAVYGTIRDWNRGDPLFRFVDLTETQVGLNSAMAPPGGDGGSGGGESGGAPSENAPANAPASEWPEGAWEVLAQTDALEPAILRLEGPNLDIIVARFHPSQTDVTNRPAFPILVANVMDAFRGDDVIPLGSPLPEGTVTLNGQPTGLRRAVVPGVYRVGDGVNERTYTSSLLSAEESRLPTGATAAVDATTAANPAGATTSRRQRGLAFWLVLAALLFLVAEWVVWARGTRGRARV